MNTASQILHFRTTGEGLVGIFRGFVLDGDHQKAIDNMIHGLHGMTYDVAIDILAGRKTLVGEDPGPGIELADETPSEELQRYLTDLLYIYGGLYCQGGWVYRPYGYAACFGEEDLPKGSVRAGTLQYRKDWSEDRARHYLRDKVNDLLFGLVLPESKSPTTWVMFEKVNTQPLIWLPRNTAQDALNECLQVGHRLEVIDWATTYGQGDTMSEEDYRGSQKEENDRIAARMEARKEVGTPEILENRTAREKRQRAQWRKKRLEFRKDYRAWRAQILEKNQAEGGTLIPLVWGRRTFMVPQIPFEYWALRRTHGSHLARPWEPFSESGLKIYGDDRWHNDWMIGAGIPLDKWYSSERQGLRDAADELMYKTQEAKLGFKCAVLSGAGKVESGLVTHPTPENFQVGTIMVIPSADPKWLKAVSMARAVITETGGAVCHLATVLREDNLVMVRVPEARKLYPPGTQVTINTTSGTVEVSHFKMLAIGTMFNE